MANAPKPIVNCHTHIFTIKHVPPLLAKSFVIWPFYHLLRLHRIARVVQWNEKRMKKIALRKKRFWRFMTRLQRPRFVRGLIQYVLTPLYYLAVFWLSINALSILIVTISGISEPGETETSVIETATRFLKKWYVIVELDPWFQFLLVAAVLLFVKSARKLILKALGMIWRYLKVVPGDKWKSLFQRYLLMGKFAFYDQQRHVYYRLKDQYPKGTGFVVLPMDMKYMDAGDLPLDGDYYDQLAALNKLKNQPAGSGLKPFVFIDPRRMDEDPNFFAYTVNPAKDNEVVLKKDTVVKSYIEEKSFSGFKIYPALGYYPFDERLLPLWKYAADHGYPIMTHCIKGTIFYRGSKDYSWNWHPVFEDRYSKLELPQSKNADFTVNFSHPLNYHILLHEPLLRQWVSTCSPATQQLFGYTGLGNELEHNLNELKICLAHFGGEEEWVRYLEGDRHYYSVDLIQDRGRGIDLNLFDPKGEYRWSSLANVWKNADWYSIICSMIIQHENLYSDLSYILSKPRIYDLLDETLNPGLNPDLFKRILFGTDFYMVRNHNSDKDLLSMITSRLSQQQFDQIARENPVEYLKLK